MTPLPCAIYTRKSSEEGLEQGFNSLDAQREACEAYIQSQKAQGWKRDGLPTTTAASPAAMSNARVCSGCWPTSRPSGSRWSWSTRSIG